MTFLSGVVPEFWGSAVIVPLYTGKGERKKCRNYRGIRLLSVVGKIYAGILIFIRVRRVTQDLIDDEQGGFREGRGYAGQIFRLKQISEKHEKKVECMWVL